MFYPIGLPIRSFNGGGPARPKSKDGGGPARPKSKDGGGLSQCIKKHNLDFTRLSIAAFLFLHGSV